MDKMEDALLITKKSEQKRKIKAKVKKDDDGYKTSVTELSREEAIERFMQLKAKEKRYKLLEQVKDVGLLLN